ncbi:MAG: phenylalanine--tRNA ligase subunit beta [Candidatus Sungbacteria bacterium]|nr:phenylalanine--tRNA ligase subunit beta [bacterium]MDZ4260691.1 phenylalanine--tRNA ligase subunit beta [Candidatus Sungbacteria bacterium]
MKFSYLWLKDIVGFRETPHKLAELLTLRSFEVESVEKVGSDYALDVKVTANRLADAAGHLGLAREIAAITNSAYKEPHIKASAGIKKFFIDVRIVPSDLCSRYTGALLEISKNGASPRWMQERLITCGLRPINAVVDVTNYVMIETGHPLHAFDADKIAGKEMLIRESKKGEEIITLDGTARILPDGVIVIQDRDRIIDLAGIMGGKNSAITEGTKTILLQAAVFDPVRIYRGSALVGLSSAASKIYAAGADSSASFAVLERAAVLLEEKQIASARRIGGAYDCYPQKAVSGTIMFRPDYADSIIGHDEGSAFYQRTFTRLGFGVKKQGRDLIVSVPARRHDINIEEDLIEEAARLLGYENITPRFPEAALVPGRKNDELWWQEEARDRLVSMGYAESELYEFSGVEEISQFGMDISTCIALAHPMNEDQSYLVPCVLIKYIVCAKENLKHADSVNIFGFGKSFNKREKRVKERRDLIIAMSRKGAQGEDEFYELKGTIDMLLESMGIEDYGYNEEISSGGNEMVIFHPYRRAEIKAGNHTIGVMGEIHPTILDSIKSKSRIVAAEFFFDVLGKLAHGEQNFHPIGKFPAIRRDIALMVAFNTKTEDILNIIEITGGTLLIDTDLFDYFQDERMRGAETKSLAFHLVFESPERTLKDEEVDTTVGNIVRALEAQGWEVRK